MLLADVARKHPGYFAPVAETPGFGEALFRLVRELRGAGYDLSDLGRLLDGATDAPEKAGSLAEILAEFEARRTGFYGPDDALLAAEPDRLDGLALLVWGMLDLPPALERLLTGVAERMPVDVYLADVPAAADAPLAELRARLIAAGATLSVARGEPAGAGHGARSRAALDVRRRRPAGDPGRRDAAARVGARPVARGARGRAGVPCSGRARGCRSGTWRSPTGTARRTCRWPRRCSSRPGSRSTCTRARRSPSGRSAARRSGCWRCSTASCRASR